MQEYLFKCTKCKKVQVVESSLVELMKKPQPPCAFCKMPMFRIYTPPLDGEDTSLIRRENKLCDTNEK